MTTHEIIILVIGIIIGWVTKFPFLLKWYRDLKKTRGYEEMSNKIRYEETKKKFKEYFENKN